jgi:hexosaminidase
MAVEPAMTDLLLSPAPRRCTVAGPGCTLADGFAVAGAPAGLVETVPGLGARQADTGPVRLAIDPAAVGEAGDEAYRLVVDAGGVRICARTATGLRWGLATLVQLRRACGAALPGLVIDDAPAFAQRGFMLDVARDRVPTMDTLRGLVDQMAAHKLNHLQLYNEHAFAYRGHEGVWRNADPITPDEMRALDAYAAARGVALTANQNSLGHFERWLRHPAYAHLGEVAGPWLFEKWGHAWMEPNTLCPLDPGSLALVEDLLAQQFACCSGAYANIGGDEPVDLGEGRSKAECERLGRGRVFSDYLGKVLRAAQRLGKRPQFWCDPHPNEDGSLPRDIIALVWGYGQTEDFSVRLAAHAAVGREVWVAPGTANWCTYAGRTEMRRGNLANAAREGLAHRAVGFLNTEWGDVGHRQQWPLALLGMAEGAQAAWTGAAVAFDDRAAGAQLFGSSELGTWLAGLGRCEQGVVRGYGSPTFTDGNTAWGSDAEPEHLAGFEAIAARLVAQEAALPAVGGLLEEECRLAVGMARYAAERAVARRKGGDLDLRRGFNRRLTVLGTTYRRLWLARSRYGGLEDSYVKVNSLRCC